MGRKKLYSTDEERKAARSKYDEKYYRRNRKKILRKQKKRRIERLTRDEGASSKTGQNVTPPILPAKSMIPKISRTARQLMAIDSHLRVWRTIIGTSEKAYCMGLYTSAVQMNSEQAFRFLSDAHDTIEEVQSKMGVALNFILETAGTNGKEYGTGLEKVDVVKRCVTAVFDLWEVAADDEDTHPAPLERVFARGGFSFQAWEEGTA